MRRYLAAGLVALFGLLGLVVATSAPVGAEASGGCRPVGGTPSVTGGPHRATVVVDPGSGEVWSACISFAGTITARHVDIGNLATAASPLFSVADLSALDLELHLPEAEAATVTLGAQVDIELLDKSTFAAKVLRRAPIVNFTGTEVGRIEARID